MSSTGFLYNEQSIQHVLQCAFKKYECFWFQLGISAVETTHACCLYLSSSFLLLLLPLSEGFGQFSVLFVKDAQKVPSESAAPGILGFGHTRTAVTEFTTPQKGWGQTALLWPESPRAGCSWLCPIRFWISSRVETLQSLWITCASLVYKWTYWISPCATIRYICIG